MSFAQKMEEHTFRKIKHARTFQTGTLKTASLTLVGYILVLIFRLHDINRVGKKGVITLAGYLLALNVRVHDINRVGNIDVKGEVLPVSATNSPATLEGYPTCL